MKWSGFMLITGIVIGFIAGYGYFLSSQKSESWHQLTSFILATPNSTMLEVFKTGYSYPDVYYGNSPNFTIKAYFWRVELETMPYYNYSESYIVYYSDAPMNIIRIWKDTAYFGNPFSSIAMLSPIEYNVTTYVEGEVRGFRFYYAFSNRKYTPVKTIYTYTGLGNYSITLAEVGIGCFKFTIEEYY
jgi:hypothetical protein